MAAGVISTIEELCRRVTEVEGFTPRVLFGPLNPPVDPPNTINENADDTDACLYYVEGTLNSVYVWDPSIAIPAALLGNADPADWVNEHGQDVYFGDNRIFAPNMLFDDKIKVSLTITNIATAQDWIKLAKDSTQSNLKNIINRLPAIFDPDNFIDQMSFFLQDLPDQLIIPAG